MCIHLCKYFILVLKTVLCFCNVTNPVLHYSDECGAIHTKPLVIKAEVQLTSFNQLNVYSYICPLDWFIKTFFGFFKNAGQFCVTF